MKEVETVVVGPYRRATKQKKPVPKRQSWKTENIVPVHQLMYYRTIGLVYPVSKGPKKSSQLAFQSFRILYCRFMLK